MCRETINLYNYSVCQIGQYGLILYTQRKSIAISCKVRPFVCMEKNIVSCEATKLKEKQTVNVHQIERQPKKLSFYLRWTSSRFILSFL